MLWGHVLIAWGLSVIPLTLVQAVKGDKAYDRVAYPWLAGFACLIAIMLAGGAPTIGLLWSVAWPAVIFGWRTIEFSGLRERFRNFDLSMQTSLRIATAGLGALIILFIAEDSILDALSSNSFLFNLVADRWLHCCAALIALFGGHLTILKFAKIKSDSDLGC